MKTISVGVSSGDYEAFRRRAESGGRSIAQLIREAMARYRAEHLDARKALAEIPVLPGHRPAGTPPARDEVYDEVFADRER